MMNVPMERAKTLSEAAQACDVQPLGGETLKRYYVSLAGRQDTLNLVDMTLEDQMPGQFPKLLFTGHVGSGKSSELAKIAEHWQEQYQIVWVQVDEDARVDDLEYTDLFLLIIQKLEEVLRKAGLAFDPILRSEFENWFKEIVQEDEKSVEGSISLSTETSGGIEIPFLAKLLSKVTAQIKGGAKQTTKIRDELRRDVKQLKNNINLLLKDGSEQIKTKFPNKLGFLVICDGLDKCPKPISERLFFDYAPQLQELHCTAIYTIPIGSLYTLSGIGRSFENPRVIPMINIYDYKGKCPDHSFDPEVNFATKGLQAMASLVERRVEIEAVFESPEQLNLLCKTSGGHLRFLMQMIRTACRIAKGRDHAKVQDEDITYAIKELQFRFEREIPPSYYATLAQIALTKQQVEDEVSPELLYSTAVLEYNGDNRWIYPNPLVRRSILFQEALHHAKQNQQN